jgi:two-component system OmpR family sensor kinase
VNSRRFAALIVLAGLPLILGLLGAMALQGDLLSNPVYHFEARIDLGTFLLIAGALLTFFAAAGVAIWYWADHRRQRAVSAAQQEAAQERRRFVRRLDHELRNPLASIRGALNYLSLGSGNDNEPARDIANQVERLARLTADLRKIAELETQAIERAPINLAELFAEVIEAIQADPERAARHIRLIAPQAPWPLPEVMGDRDLLWLAFYNLLDNAWKFTGPEDAIEVRAFEDGRQLVVEVADTGPGIPDEDLPHLFEELYRGGNAAGVAGSGLGLALVNQIVVAHGGTITVRSRLEGGVAFTVRLPLPLSTQ